MTDIKTQAQFNFNDLCIKYYDEIFHYIRRQVDQTEDAKDLTQDVFMKVYNKFHTYNKEKASIRTWIYRIAYNHTMNYYRSSYNKKVQMMGEGFFDLYSQKDDILEYCLKQEEVEGIVILMKKLLNKKHLKITNLYFFGGFSYLEISNTLDVPLKTVRNIINLSINKIKKSLEEISHE